MWSTWVTTSQASVVKYFLMWYTFTFSSVQQLGTFSGLVSTASSPRSSPERAFSISPDETNHSSMTVGMTTLCVNDDIHVHNNSIYRLYTTCRIGGSKMAMYHILLSFSFGCFFMNATGPSSLRFFFGKPITVNSLPFGRPRFLCLGGSLRFEISDGQGKHCYCNKYHLYLHHVLLSLHTVYKWVL